MSTLTTPVRCALVGCGRFGRYFAELIREKIPAIRITAAVAHPLDDAAQIQSLIGAVPIHHTITELLDNSASEIDAVILTSANYEHRGQAIAAARAGKHIFCEKPMALTVEDCLAMVNAAQQNKIKLMVGHKRRLRPAWRKLIDVCRSGSLGTIVAANINGWHYHDDIPAWWLDPKTGGGLLHRAGCHDIDFLNALLGESKWVRAIASPNARGDAAQFNETMWLTIGYASGAVAGLQVSLWFQPIHFRDSFDVQVLGTNGSALLNRHADQTQELILSTQGSDDSQRITISDDATDAYLTELNSFAAWITRDEPPVLTWREGLACVQVMQAAYESAREFGRKIAIEKLHG